jgi:TraM recognition site of TraD and TraG
MVFALAIAFVVALVTIPTFGVAVIRMRDQRWHDDQLKTYEISFPSNLDSRAEADFFNAIAHSRQVSKYRFGSAPTTVFEMLAVSHELHYRLRLTDVDYRYVSGQLTTLVPGTSIERIDDSPIDWDVAAEYSETNKHLPLNIDSAERVAASLLRSVQHHQINHSMLVQVIISPPGHLEKPPKDRPTRQYTTKHRVLFGPQLAASRDEVEARRSKLNERNVLAVIRVAAKAPTPKLAEDMLANVGRVLHGTSLDKNKMALRRSGQRVIEAVKSASAPLIFPSQLSVTELMAFVAWPIGEPNASGLPVGKTRQLPAGPDVARAGIVLGHSTFSDDRRPVALTTTGMTMHTYICGPPGTGKTVADANIFYQHISQGFGAAVVETKGEKNDFYHKALNYIPRERIKDVVVIDVTDVLYPVGFNILQQGKPQVVAANIDALFEETFGLSSRLRVPAALYHGLMVLMTTKNAPASLTFTDLPLLYAPRSQTERDFAEQLIRGTPDPEIRGWWEHTDNLYPTLDKRHAFFEPMIQRLWVLNGRSEIRNIFGQSQSSIDIAEGIRERKIFLFNIAGFGPDVRNLLGSIIITAIWEAIKDGVGDPQSPFLLGLDEFQNYPTLGVGFPEMASEGRAHGLSLLLSNQNPMQLNLRVMQEVFSNVRNTIVYQADNKTATMFASEFGKLVSPDDFIRLGEYEAICRVMGSRGRSEPFTVQMQPPLKQPGLARKVIERSRRRYGRPVGDVQREITERRQAVGGSRQKKKPAYEEDIKK